MALQPAIRHSPTTLLCNNAVILDINKTIIHKIAILLLYKMIFLGNKIILLGNKIIFLGNKVIFLGNKIALLSHKIHL